MEADFASDCRRPKSLGSFTRSTRYPDDTPEGHGTRSHSRGHTTIQRFNGSVVSYDHSQEGMDKMVSHSEPSQDAVAVLLGQMPQQIEVGLRSEEITITYRSAFSEIQPGYLVFWEIGRSRGQIWYLKSHFG